MFYICSVNRYDDMPDETPEERDARHHRVLHRLGDLLMAEAEALGADAETPRVEKAPAVSRIARAVRATLALDARLGAWAIERERKARAVDAEKAGDARREHLRKTKLDIVLAFRDAVELGVDREFLDHAERLMEGDLYDEELVALPFTEALAIIANDLGGDFDRKTFGKPPPSEAADETPADPPPPEFDPMCGANAIEDDPPHRPLPP
jgi:hypothetical protein